MRIPAALLEGVQLRPSLRTALFVALVVAAFAVPRVAAACPVCFGDSDSPMAQGLNNGMLVLLGVVATVQGGFAALFLAIRYRTKRLRERKESFQIIDGGRS